MKQRGFTVIELLVAIVFLAGAGTLFFVQKNNIQTAGRDEHRKTAINAMYFSLEEGFYAKNNYYPSTVNEKNLTTVDSALFTDPNSIKIGQTTVTQNSQTYTVASDYRYEPTNCTDSKCKSYTLRANLENEADYIKTSRHN